MVESMHGMNRTSRLPGWLPSRFLRDERGAVTIEFTFLVPFFVLLLVLFADSAVVYLTHTEMFNVARDAARRMSTGQLKTNAEVVTYAQQHLHLGSRTYGIEPNFGSNNQVTVFIHVSEAAIFGYWFGPVLGQTLAATATVQAEPPLVKKNP